MTCKVKRIGRPSGFTAELGEKLCDLLSEGRSVLAISKMDGMPPESTIRGWARKAKWSNEAFVASYAHAREMGADHEFDRIEEIEQRLEREEIDPHAARVLIDSIKWRLSKKLPRIYGERSHLEVSGGLKVESPKDHAPDWLRERLAEQVPTAISASDEDEDTIH